MPQSPIIDTVSPAKINLMLRVLRRRPDNYHDLQTYFHLLKWGDRMIFTLSDEDEIDISGDFQDLRKEDNLIYKAIMLLRPHRNICCGIHINVRKKIPQGSGLGGGSSNAATTLKAVNELWQCQLSDQELMKLGLQLGADVPVFIMNQPALAEGVGEVLTPMRIGSFWITLVFPGDSVSTAEVFNHPSLDREQQQIAAEQVHKRQHWTNACTQVVLQTHPKVQSCYEQASQWSDVYMSGTGATLFSVFATKAEAEEFQSKLSTRFQTAVVQTY